MPEVMSYTAPSVELSPIASTRERRVAGRENAEIGYDEERAETNPGACNERTSI